MLLQLSIAFCAAAAKSQPLPPPRVGALPPEFGDGRSRARDPRMEALAAGRLKLRTAAEARYEASFMWDTNKWDRYMFFAGRADKMLVLNNVAKYKLSCYVWLKGAVTKAYAVDLLPGTETTPHSGTVVRYIARNPGAPFENREDGGYHLASVPSLAKADLATRRPLIVYSDIEPVGAHRHFVVFPDGTQRDDPHKVTSGAGPSFATMAVGTVEAAWLEANGLLPLAHRRKRIIVGSADQGRPRAVTQAQAQAGRGHVAT